LGSGAGDIVHESEKMGNKRLDKFKVDTNEMIFKDVGGNSTKTKSFKVSDLIVTPDAD